MLISVLGSISIILSIISASSYYILKDKEVTRFTQATVDLSKQLEVILVDPIFSYDLAVLQRAIDSYATNPIVAKILIEDQKQRPMVSIETDRTVSITNEIAVHYSGDRHVGTVFVSYSRDEINALLGGKIFETTLNLAITLIALGACLILLIRYVLVRPITRVSKVISEMNKNGCFDLQARAPVNSKDEVGVLASSFNQTGGRAEHQCGESHRTQGRQQNHWQRAGRNQKYR